MLDDHNFVSNNSTHSNKYYISTIKQKFSTMSNPQYNIPNFQHNPEPEEVDEESMFKKFLGDQLLKSLPPGPHSLQTIAEHEERLHQASPA